MDVQATIGSAWERHADTPDEVLGEALELVGRVPGNGIAGLANLLFHVGGEHLGRFAIVEEALEALLAAAEDASAASSIHRLLAACALCTGAEDQARVRESRASGDPEVNRGIVLGLAACAEATRGRAREAAAHFEAASVLAEGKEALHKSVAITGNNLAAGLEQRADRSPEDDALMLRAAEVARVFWERAGTWMNVERAEYRLAATRLARGEPTHAIEHGERALSIIRENGGNAGEEFFAWEILARALRARGDRTRALDARDRAAACLPNVADEGFRTFCVGSLKKLDALLGESGSAS